MYGGIQGSVAVPVTAAASTAVLLPATGADSMATIAAAVFAGLIVWGAVYYYRVVRG